MNASHQALARDKEILVARSTLCRLRLAGQVQDVRDSLRWRRAAMAVAAAPGTRRIAFGVAVALLGLGRAARLITMAARVVVFAKLASALAGWVRGERPPTPGLDPQETGVRQRTEGLQCSPANRRRVPEPLT